MAIVQTTLLATRGKALRIGNDGAPKQGSGHDAHVLSGSSGANAAGLEYRSFVDFEAVAWKPIAKIVKIELALKVEDDTNHFVYGSTPKIKVNLLKAPFHDGTSPENAWDPAEWEGNPALWPLSASLTLPLDNSTDPPRPPDGQFVYVDVTTLCKPIVSTNTHMPDGSVGLGKPIHGFLIHSQDAKHPVQRAVFYSYRAASGNRPKLIITYEQANTQPTAPTGLAPTGDVSWAATLTGTHHDPDGDPMAARRIRVWSTGTGAKVVWTLDDTLSNASSEETQTGVFSVPLSAALGKLNLGTAYDWDAATRDTKGAPADWANATYSAKTRFTITSSGPSVAISPVGSVATMAGAKFGGTYTDPEANPMDRFRIQVGPVGVDWGSPVAVLWDTGEAQPTALEATDKKVARDYGGGPLLPGNYTYRFSARDNTGIWSAWVEAAWSLASAYNPDFGSVLPVAQIDRKPQYRIALWSVFADYTIPVPVPVAGRGRGMFIGYIDDPIDLGASGYLNAGGELYFSLPALHPYCPSIEPHKVHYAVEQYYGDRYRALFNGLITDFDADTDTVTFYGTDYLGLLQTAVDERYDPNGPDKPADGNGGGFSKYVDKTIDYVIKDQIRYHSKQPNSPIKFITEAPAARFDALPERVTIHSTYSECLPFITGLMDSHKQGTGKESRFYVHPTNADFSAFEFSLKDNWGVDRPDIHLEYGQIITDFRVVALGDFGTRVLGVGQKRGEVKVYRATGVATGMDETQWGRRAQTRFYQDIIDQNDLQRRVNEDANVLAKIGKRMALAFKADALTPFDGWDLGDSIVMDIRRGVVNTMNYGSNGFWTIYGVEFRYSQDGHTDLTLTTLPKKVATTAPSDLIPSINPGLSLQWQTGFGVPAGYGQPPTPSTGPGLLGATDAGVEALAELPLSTDPVNAFRYADLNTGCVYELDETAGTYSEVYCPVQPEDIPPTYEPDIDAPPVPVIKALIALEATPQEDGTVAGALQGALGYVPPSPAGLADLSTYIVQSTRYILPDLSGPDFDKASEWRAAAEDQTGTLDTFVVQPGALPGEVYYWRAAAVDHAGNRSAWSDPPASVTAASDDDGPPRVTGFAVLPGNTTLGAHWDPVPASDLDYVEVRIRQTVPTVDPTWVNLRATGTVIIIAGLKNTRPDLVPPAPVAYELQVRSVDTSGNTLHDPGTGTLVSVKAEEQPDQGWIASVTASPTAIPGDALVWSDVIIGNVFAGKINADWIKAGTLTVGTGAKKGAAAIEVWDNHDPPRLVGKWSAPDGTDPGGIEVLDPANTNYHLRITAASLQIIDDSAGGASDPVVDITPRGIDAASVTFGLARGGHNLVANSSFEMGAFVQSSAVVQTWDVAADFNAAGSRQGADVNVTTGATLITMITVT